MGRILVPGENTPAIDPKDPAKPQQIKATPIYQDQNFTILKHKEGISQGDVFDLPLHLIQIALNQIDAHKYVPIIGKEKFTEVVKRLKKDIDKHIRTQKAIAAGIVEKTK